MTFFSWMGLPRIFWLIPLLFIGCSVEAATINLNPGDFAQVIAQEEVFVLDTHIPEQQHIKGTDALIPFDALEQFKDKLPSKDTPIAIYCRSGSMSAEASQTLKEMGYKKVYNLLGGANAWRSAGLPFEQVKQ
ncbi:rhodanese-like domain-containing protein [Candidatus Woesearchaeota archaeon]|nr:rhodanese-like domain-containing protein [Candidatus Woesearchaeota archaeon]